MSGWSFINGVRWRRGDLVWSNLSDLGMKLAEVMTLRAFSLLVVMFLSGSPWMEFSAG